MLKASCGWIESSNAAVEILPLQAFQSAQKNPSKATRFDTSLCLPGQDDPGCAGNEPHNIGYDGAW
jgi:hypothetical protein